MNLGFNVVSSLSSLSRRPVLHNALGSFHHHDYCDIIITRCFSSLRKKRRRTKSLADEVGPPTTRQRLRQVVELNQSAQHRRQGDPSLQKMAAVASQRIQWLQTSIYKHWNPDYQPPLDPNNKTTQFANQQQVAVRPRIKRGVIMDGRWWFWNIMFALAPAILISLYCELRVQPAMDKFYARQAQRRQAGQEQTAPMNNNNALMVPESVETKLSFQDRWQNVRNELSALILSNGVPREQGAKDEATVEQRKDSHRHGGEPSPNETSSMLRNKKLATKEDPITLQVLLQRIEQLERLMGQRQQQLVANQEESSPQAQQPPMAEADQSGIRRRIQERIRQEAQRSEAEASREKEGERMVQSMDWLTTIWKSVKGMVSGQDAIKDEESDGTSSSTTVSQINETANASKATDHGDIGQKVALNADSSDARAKVAMAVPAKHDTETKTTPQTVNNVNEPDGMANKKRGPWWQFW